MVIMSFKAHTNKNNRRKGLSKWDVIIFLKNVWFYMNKKEHIQVKVKVIKKRKKTRGSKKLKIFFFQRSKHN